MDERRPGPGGAVVPAGRITVSREVVRIGESLPAGHAPHGEPRVELVREGGVIRLIEVTCSCGEVIRIRCEYGG